MPKNKTCVYSSCKSDSRKEPLIGWANFVKPSADRKRAELWVSLVNRSDFTVEDITKYKFICVKHFDPSEIDLDYRYNSGLTPFPEGSALVHYLRKRKSPERVLQQQTDPKIDHEYAQELNVVSYERKRPRSSDEIPRLQGVGIAMDEDIYFNGCENDSLSTTIDVELNEAILDSTLKGKNIHF